MTGEDALAELKAVLYESDYDGAWSDAILTSYLSEGQDRFCEDTGLFIDPVNYSIVTREGVADYKLNDRIKRVYNAICDGRELIQYDAKHGRITGASSHEGVPEYYRTDYAPGYIRFTPIPQGEHQILLRVWRYSRYPFEESGEFELPSQFHRAPIEWAAYKALNHHDMELQDPVKGRDHYDNYQMYVNRGKEWLHQLLGAIPEIVPNPLYVV